jgi:hypothetical protein
VLTTIRYEQAVYGSFPFWHRGYAVLARSGGCREEWIDALRLAGQRFGERPTGVVEHTCFFALRLRSGPWMIVGVFPQGWDDLGRPGALAFHALFVGRWSYLKAGSNPFVFVPALRGDWNRSDQDRHLNVGQLIPEEQQPDKRGSVDDQIETIASALKRGQRVVLASPQPISDLARAVWFKLPARLRRRTTLATWAFSNANQFDLIAGPLLTNLAPGPSDFVLGEKSGAGV